MPKRIQRKRTKGWRMPDATVYVGRPSRWGNPFSVETKDLGSVVAFVVKRDGYEIAIHEHRTTALSHAIEMFRFYALERLENDPTWVDPLRWLDLCCWCPLTQPCHADVLLDLARSVAAADTDWYDPLPVDDFDAPDAMEAREQGRA